MSEVETFDIRAIRRRFERAAKHFDDADFIHRTTASGLFERMLPMQIKPEVIADVGSGPGRASRQLAKQYRQARIVSLDLSPSMLRRAASGIRLFSRIREVQADAARIPLSDSSVDLLFANLLMPWLNDLPAFLAEAARVLRKDGLLMFSTLGPSSFAELRDAWQGIDDLPHVGDFEDMHNIGDALVRAGLRDPVLDVDYLGVSYRDTETLLRDLSAVGARNVLRARRPTLTGKNRFDNFRKTLFADGPLELRLELVYGHAWGGDRRQAAGEFSVPAKSIGIRRG